jgi:hypothetical protein
MNLPSPRTETALELWGILTQLTVASFMHAKLKLLKLVKQVTCLASMET